MQEKIRVALRNVDKVIADNEVAVKDTLRNFETLHGLAVRQRRENHQHHRLRRIRRRLPSTTRFGKTQDFLKSLGSDKYGGDLLPTIISLRELIESFDKKSGALIAERRKMLGDLSQSINKAGQKLDGRPGASLPPRQQPRTMERPTCSTNPQR